MFLTGVDSDVDSLAVLFPIVAVPEDEGSTFSFLSHLIQHLLQSCHLEIYTHTQEPVLFF